MAKSANQSLKRKRTSKTIAPSSESDGNSFSDDSHSLDSSNDDLAIKSDLSEIAIPDELDVDSLPEPALKYLRQLQQKANDAADRQRKAAREALGDRTNGQDGKLSEQHKARKKQKLFDEEEIRCLARCYAATRVLWFRGSAIKDGKIDVNYNPVHRFETKRTKVQGQLYDVIDILPEEVKEVVNKDGRVPKAIMDVFIPAMGVQRSNMATRVRNVIGPTIFGIAKEELAYPETRNTQENIDLAGLNKTNPNGYSAFDVPLLHSNFATTLDIDAVFLNPMLIQLYSGIIRGPSSVHAMKAGRDISTPAQTMVQVWDLDHVTPGAIATAAVLARWCISADNTLKAIGDRTKINWAKDFHLYLQYLTKGLERNKRSVKKIFKVWNDTLFPGVDQSERVDSEAVKRSEREEAALDALNNDADVESEDDE